ncbi:SDR family NAD(P)-dependent oxidoreductase [Natrinema sp. 1APR25-10V2]|uniref:SDR family NAD(P)-dependent oxidoreductase n=1 Tax=Natrinema sp. 1APR25-10V2 TaxID=2951081 RepID=UPI00287551C4|nr:SDR family NAD(P)-dependent oxidoreductase [Natrinema sp. 1APR25-10V2]MDS0477615.1 SDR family NAD(P)-dependent oxidoreductase [Natrinema sp. 1APR25-10V2]
MTTTALVTGCSSGIGYETARALLDHGWRVYATARDRDRDGLEKLADRGADIAALDLTEPDDIDRVVSRIREEAGGVDCLVNNAGYGQFGPVEDVPTILLERQFAVHCFGPHRLIRAVLPGMRRRGRGRIVTVTSAADRLALAGIGGYTASKWAMASLSDALRQELVDTDIDVVVVQPGIVKTPFYDRAVRAVGDAAATRDRSRSDSDATAAERNVTVVQPDHYTDLYRVLRRLRAVEAGGPFVNEPERVASTIREAATDRNPDTHYRVGPVPLLGSLYGTLVPGSIRDRLTRLGVRLAASEPVLDLLERRTADADAERYPRR